MFQLSFLQWICLIPTVGGSIFGLACVWAVRRLRILQQAQPITDWPPVTILKPVCGLEKGLSENLRSACLQEYPEFQVVLSVQSAADPAVPIIRRIQREFGPEKVSVVAGSSAAVPNGKVGNLMGALKQARHEILVISDSDIRLPPDYLRNIVPPLLNPRVGGVCTLYRACAAERWFEKLELLTMNGDFVPSVVFAAVTGAARFCLGSSLALRRSVLEAMGGLESLADYLVEDYEIGRRIRAAGKELALVPHWVNLIVDLKSVRQWADHQVCWDQKTFAAQPAGFLAGALTRSVPFALIYAALRLGDPLGVGVLAGATFFRLASAGLTLKTMGDREGIKSLWLLPLRDVAGLWFWFRGATRKKVHWRGREFILTGGRLRRRE